MSVAVTNKHLSSTTLNKVNIRWGLLPQLRRIAVAEDFPSIWTMATFMARIGTRRLPLVWSPRRTRVVLSRNVDCVSSLYRQMQYPFSLPFARLSSAYCLLAITLTPRAIGCILTLSWSAVSPMLRVSTVSLFYLSVCY